METTHPLRVARLAKGLTMEQLAVHAGVSYSTVSRIERRMPFVTAPATWVALARELGVAVSEINGHGPEDAPSGAPRTGGNATVMAA